MPFGKYKGQEIRDIRTEYLEWVLDNCKHIHPLLREEIESVLNDEETPSEELDRLRSEVKELERRRSEVEEFIRVWYSKISRKAHPDRGGDTEVMQMINELKDWFGAN